MYCKNVSCFNEETCKEQCKDCKNYDICDDVDREVDVALTTKEDANMGTVIIETTFKLKT